MSIKNVELMQVYFLLTYIVKQHDIKCLKIVYTIDKKCLKIFYIVTKKGASNLSDQMPPGVQVNCQLTYRQLTCYLWQYQVNCCTVYWYADSYGSNYHMIH